MSLLQQFARFDFLSKTLVVEFDKRSAPASLIGAGTSVAFVGLLLSLTYFIGADYFDTSRPAISRELIPMDYQPTMNIVQEKRVPVVFMRFVDMMPVSKEELPKYFTLLFAKVVRVPGQAPRREEFHFVPCADLLAKKKASSFSSEQDASVLDSYIKFGYCVDLLKNEDLSLGGSVSQLTASTFLSISPCVLGSQCKSKEEISLLGFSVNFQTPYENYGDYINPVKYLDEIGELEHANFGLTLKKKLVYRKNEVFKSNRILGRPTKTHSFFELEKKSATIEYRKSDQLACSSEWADECKPYYLLEQVVSKTLAKTTREYKSFIESVSEVGGILEIVYFFFSSIYGFYSRAYLKKELVRQLFGISKPPKKQFGMLSPFRQMNMYRYHKTAHEKANSLLDVRSLSKDLCVLRYLTDLLLPDDLREELPKLFIVSQISEVQKQTDASPKPQSLTKRKTVQKTLQSPGLLLAGKNHFSKHGKEETEPAKTKSKVNLGGEQAFGSSNKPNTPDSERNLKTCSNREENADKENLISAFRRDLTAKIRYSMTASESYLRQTGVTVQHSLLEEKQR